MTFAAWIASGAEAPVVLCVLSIREQVRHWTADATPGVYWAAWPSLFGSVPGGCYREFTLAEASVSDSTGATVITTLTGVASVAQVGAGLDRAFLDAATDRIYVQVSDHGATPAALHPDLAIAMVLTFKLFMATEPVTFTTGRLYWPLLTGVLPAFRTERKDRFFGIATDVSGGLEIANADGLFDSRCRAWIWKSSRAAFAIGGRGMDESDFQALATLEITDAIPGDASVSLELKARTSVFEQDAIYLTISEAGDPWGLNDGYPRLGDGVSGLLRPYLLGSVTDLIPPLIDTRVSGGPWLVTQRYLISDGTIYVLEVRAVERGTNTETVLTEGLHWEYDDVVFSPGEHGAIIVNGTLYPAATYDIHVDVFSYDHAPTFGAIVLSLLRTAGVQDADLDLAAFAAADLAAPQVLGRWITEAVSVGDVIRRLEQSVLGRVFIDTAGRWTCRIWDPRTDVASMAVLPESDQVDWEPDAEGDSVFRGAICRYQYHPATQTWLEEGADHPETAVRYNVVEVVSVETDLQNAGDAEELAGRLQALGRQTPIRIDVGDLGLQSLALSVGDRLAVMKARGLTLAGTYDHEPLEIVALEKSLNPVGVHLTLEDLGGLGSRVREWADAGDPDWAAATVSERRTSLFWSGDDHRPDPADATSEDNGGIWW